ncbi:hypothetical protein EJB05_08339 [Eragrostis curvula]|uniref:Uncharacterized protein n=1 Tax=Eragrostis curvula TaxID=38414 RepID=A0A5J9WN50_9POAL|nr:hypothetical protein EJB05_08339 [Eragrostis curvula]
MTPPPPPQQQEEEQAAAAGSSSHPDPAAPPDASSSAATLPSRNATSKYDFVKVKVWLGENADHYYVLSRFLLSRMLTVTKIPNHVAIKIALELKKLLVDNSLLDVSQTDLEANLFKTDMVYELLRTSTDAPLTSVPVWARDFNTPEELITEFCRECRVVRKGLAGDLKKAMKDGKPIIIEGIHLDPSIYLMDEEKGVDNSRMEKKVADLENPGISVEMKTEHQAKNGLAENEIIATEENESSFKSPECLPKEGSISESLPYANSHGTNYCNSAHSKEKSSKDEGDRHKDLDQQKNNAAKKVKPAAEPIVVPIVLRMADFDHKALLEEWIATRASRDNSLPQDHRKLINNLNLIQDYLCSFERQGLTVVDISADSFPQMLDWLHSYLLQCIERGLLAACSESCKQGGS